MTNILRSMDTKFAQFENNFRGDLNPFNVELKDTLDPILKYGIYKENIGIILLKSFLPSSKDAISLASQIRDLLVNIFDR